MQYDDIYRLLQKLKIQKDYEQNEIEKAKRKNKTK